MKYIHLYKRTIKIIALAAIAIVLTFTGCAKAPLISTADGKTLIFEDDNRTFKYINDVYHYRIADNDIYIIYPNGYIYSQNINSNTATKSWSIPTGMPEISFASEIGYIDENYLVDAILKYMGMKSKESTTGIFVIFISAAAGLWGIISPGSLWYVSYGWRYKNAQPTQAAIILNRIAGVILLMIVIFKIFPRI